MKNYILTFLSIFLLIFSEGAEALKTSVCHHDASAIDIHETACNSGYDSNFSCADCKDFLKINTSKIASKGIAFNGKILSRNKNTTYIAPIGNYRPQCHPPGIDFYGLSGKIIRHHVLSSIIFLT